MKKVLVLGATSAIAQATVRLLAARGASLYLVGRNVENLDAVAKDAATRGAAKVESKALDLNDFSAHEALVDGAFQALGGLDGVVLAHGVLGDQTEAQRSWAATEAVLRTNFLSAVSLLTALANRFEAQKAGTLVVISSVAGDRGRQSNYVYGASKGALNVFLQGLRNRLAKSNVAVVTVKPGFVDTPMTAHIPKNKLFASPEKVARGLLSAADGRKNEVYVPGIWALIMLIIKSIPESVFKKLKL
ncbi:SDR family oxidoreductase [Myxococcus sp. MISCRS1]|jgi:short-subunit dehydrogenase|uniref:Short-chain dehydrogenase n=1 Tax=Myxococcus fulvus TaxID=33 RepID=A0A511T091_MYXFU|nr:MULTISPECIES: SDR family oxidoreductase [Myxococcus]AKF83834.1 short-chain dehydrogenase [Myxococcus fulvus 124B02]BDT37780.1 SDR family oxidoreductase [Myxococcus sp. MH1]MBZ4396270.1 SDR family oxidoreductase [Myxococcus sp. AS-1-15]MBZ4413103.1 SDR family oxidoreductase [Myxococcus sp. XM-1-1-1]MCK8498779.1 SDR family oxidoreductase [Myxococcus fulvus]